MRLKENNQLKLISFLIAILLFISVNENFKNFSVFGNCVNKSSEFVFYFILLAYESIACYFYYRAHSFTRQTR